MKLTQFETIGGVPLYRDDLGAVCFRAGCTINADGSPHAYAPDASGLTAFDYLANAGSPGNWWGIAVNDSGSPYLQSPWHPAPGYYVSTTALVNPAVEDEGHPSRYVDSERYCFGVIPGGQSFAKLGDVGLAYNQETGDNMYFAVADIGPQDRIGEGSMLLGRCLGFNASPKTGGTSKRIVSWVILPNSAPGYEDWEPKCRRAMDLVADWGGLERLKEISREMA